MSLEDTYEDVPMYELRLHSIYLVVFAGKRADTLELSVCYEVQTPKLGAAVSPLLDGLFS